VATSKLSVGDFQIIRDDGLMLIVERKTPQDLLGSIGDGRLMKQCASIGNMILDASESENSRPVLGFLLIVGKLYPIKGKTHTEAGETNWNWASVQGALLTVQGLGMKIYHAESEFELEKVIISLSKKDFVGEYWLPPDKSLAKISPTIAMLANLPGIGIEKALVLSGHTHDNFIHSLKVLLDHDTKIKGIGKLTKEAIRNAIGIEEDQSIVIVDRVDGLEKIK
jgi:ERCC4-type nuclease